MDYSKLYESHILTMNLENRSLRSRYISSPKKKQVRTDD